MPSGSIVAHRCMSKECIAANGKSFTSAIAAQAGGVGAAIAPSPNGFKTARPSQKRLEPHASDPSNPPIT